MTTLKVPTLHPTVAQINYFILDLFPKVWIHNLDDHSEIGTLKIKLSGISTDECSELQRQLYQKLPAGLKLDLKLASTASEFFKTEITRPNAPWKDIK
jgi:hypothetical protein